MNSKLFIGKHLAINGIWALFASIFSAIASILHTAILSRILTPADLGTYLLLLSIVMFMVIPGNFGLPDSAVRTISKELGAGRLHYILSFLGKCFLICFIAACLVFLIIVSGPGGFLITSLFKINTSFTMLILIAIWVVAVSLHALVVESLRGLNDIKNASIYGTLLKNVLILIILVGVWILIDDINVTTVITSITVAILLTLALSSNKLHTNISALKQQSLDQNQNDRYPIANIIRMSAPFFLNALTAIIIVRIGIWVVGYYLPKDDVAIYGACLQLVLLVIIPLTIINAILPPLVSNLFFNESNNTKLQTILRTCATVAGIPSIFALLLFVFYGAEVLALVFGEFYSKGALILLAFAIGQSTNMLVGPTGTVLKMTNHQSLLLKVNIIFGILTTVFSIYTAKYHGLTATAFVTAISMVTKNLYTHYLVRKHVGVNCAIYLRFSDFKNLYRNIMQLKTSILARP